MGEQKKMHLIFPHYFQSFYSTTNDFCPQQIQIRLTERESGCIGVGLNGLNTHRRAHQHGLTLCRHATTHTHAVKPGHTRIDNLECIQWVWLIASGWVCEELTWPWNYIYLMLRREAGWNSPRGIEVKGVVCFYKRALQGRERVLLWLIG